MGGKNLTITRSVNGVVVDQKVRDGFINGTAMAVAHNKNIADWFRNQETIELLIALAYDLGLPVPNYGIFHNSSITALSATFPELINVKRGSPENGGGTWLHPDLAIQLAQWCNKPFAIQVSRWIREWWNSSYNPSQLESDTDRVQLRDELKDRKRLEFTGQIKAFLVAAGKYNPSSFHTRKTFWEAHDKLNVLLTTETAKQMRERLEATLGRSVSEQDLLRDYFPIGSLADYASLCQAAANEMAINGTSPLQAIDIAARQVLPRNYAPTPIDFTERIGLVRRRLEQRDQLLLRGA